MAAAGSNTEAIFAIPREFLMGRRILNRKEMRADFDAAERRQPEAEEESDEEEEEDADAEDEEGDEEEEAEGEEKPAAEDEDEEVEVAPKKKKARVTKPKTTTTKSRSRAAKVVRQRVVWGVFNNSNQCVATYEYPRRQEAVDHAAKLTADKKSTHFIQPVKEPMPSE
jgi:hypothetical protein